MQIFIPKKLNVGFQNRDDTYTGRLAYVIYFDEKGKLRKECSWQSWRDEKIPNEIYDNEPTEGFVLNKKVGGYGGWDPRKTYTRVYDPRGFEFEITIQNLLWILENCNCIKGKGLEGQFVYGWDGSELLLVPVESPDYKEIKEKTEIKYNNNFVKAKDLIVGAAYETLNGEQYVFMGKFKPWDKKTNRHYNLKGSYQFPQDGTWGFDPIGKKISEHPHYFKYIQSERFAFFFIRISKPGDHIYNNHEVVLMSSVNRKFIKMVLNPHPDYPEFVEFLNKDNRYSPEDYDSDRILD